MFLPLVASRYRKSWKSFSNIFLDCYGVGLGYLLTFSYLLVLGEILECEALCLLSYVELLSFDHLCVLVDELGMFQLVSQDIQARNHM